MIRNTTRTEAPTVWREVRKVPSVFLARSIISWREGNLIRGEGGQHIVKASNGEDKSQDEMVVVGEWGQELSARMPNHGW
jgi:hypothetical protein